MSIWSRLGAAFKRREPQNVAYEESFWKELTALAHLTQSGQLVNAQTAMQVTTALRCGLVISDGVSTVPCKLMHKDASGKRRVVPGDEHPLAEVLSYEANPFMDPLQFLETTALHTVFTGDSVSFVNRVRGRVVEIIPLKPDAVRIQQEQDWRVRYFVIGRDGTEREFPREAIWHVRSPSWDGVKGLDVTKLAREALGLAMATEKAHATRFANGVNTSGVYSISGTLDEAGYNRLRAYIDQNMAGAQNSGKPFILDRDAKWTPLAMTGADAEHVATRELQIQEICRAYGVLPIMVGFSDKTATYASAEQMFLAHAVHTIRPWHRRYERSMMRQLLTRDDYRAGYYIKFIDTELLRGAAKDRADYYGKLFQVGGLSPNQILELEDMDGFENGDTHYVPANMADASKPLPAQTKPEPSSKPAPKE